MRYISVIAVAMTIAVAGASQAAVEGGRGGPAHDIQAAAYSGAVEGGRG